MNFNDIFTAKDLRKVVALIVILASFSVSSGQPYQNNSLEPGSYERISEELNQDEWLGISDTWIYQKAYQVKESDICSPISNNVTVTATDPCSEPVSWQDNLTIPATYDAELFLEKTSDKSGEQVSPGEEITYSYYITNEGNINLTAILISDDQVPSIDYISGDENGDLWLNLSETWIYEGRYRVRDSDLCKDIVNTAQVTAIDPCSHPVTPATDTEVVKTTCETYPLGLEEPIQYEQYCEAQKFSGSGEVELGTTIIDTRIALDYRKSIAGDGDIEMNSEHILSENASRLQREVINKTVPLNFFETSQMSFSGSSPLMGERSLSSREFYGGIGSDVREMFAVNEMESVETIFFASTDPAGHLDDKKLAEELRSASPVHLMGLDTANRFNGTWGTETQWHKILQKDIQDRQMFSGSFEAEKLIKLHESPIREPWSPTCKGVDC
ncbi:MAG: hypothetical protein GKC10_06320 [Methanosarcinales archaeon]|nr:hypothetical protein [Methanosarcinales archaeon]